jgi:competence protein ComEA
VNFRGDRLKFSSKEKRAALLFLVVLMGLVIVPSLISRFTPNITVSYSVEEDSIRQEIERKYNTYEQRREATKRPKWESFSREKRTEKKVDTPFNPDTVSASGWVELGLSPRQAEVLLAYKDRIGGFNDISQLYKAYVLDSNRVNQWKPFLVFEKKKVKRIELNSASLEELITLKGIGQGYAKRIVNYRDKLGGFHQVDQIKEIYNFPIDLANAIESQLRVDTLLIHKIRINFVSVEELAKHPYFDYKTARTLLNYRQEHGAFTSMLDILKCKAVEAETSKKWLPYLNFEQ